MPRRLLQLALGLILGLPLLAANPGAYDKIGHQLICQCGCTQVLLECNHVGCPVSPVMINELHTQLASAIPLAGVLNWFAAKYGPIVLAAPIRGGFDTVAWVVPFGVLLLGTFGVAVLIQLWRRRHLQLAPLEPSAAGSPASDQIRARIRQETGYD